MTKIICLASGSKSRKLVLQRANIRFEIRPSNIEEIHEDETPEEYVLKLAEQKARAVKSQTKADIIVAADSVVVLGNDIIEKPKNIQEGIEILTELQGRTHQFYTGLSVIDRNTGETKSELIVTEVTFSQLDQEIIKEYITLFKPFSFAGGYDNGISSWFIEKIDGPQSNLMGLPMVTLREIITDFGYDWIEFIDHEKVGER